jgi:serine/threonine-protein kinase
LFLEVASAARSAGKQDREQLARRRAASLESKLSYLVIEVPPSSDGVLVKRDGEELREGAFGTKVPVDPGSHVIEASAPGKRSWSRTVQVDGTEPVTVKVPALEPESNGEAAPSGADSASGRDTTAPGAVESSGAAHAAVPAESSGPWDTQRTVSVAVAGLGVVAVAAGTYFFVNFGSKNDEARKICPASVDCEPGDVSRHSQLVDDARRSRTLGYVGVGVGAAAIATGAVLFFTAPTAASSQQAWTVRPVVTPALAYVGAGRAW